MTYACPKCGCELPQAQQIISGHLETKAAFLEGSRKFFQDMFNPEALGWAVTPEVRKQARKLLELQDAAWPLTYKEPT